VIFSLLFRLLLAHGADVNAQSSSGNTPLMYACAGGHEDVSTLYHSTRKAVLRIRDVYPGSRISDPKTAIKERGEKN
jgi:ankyrin repeat protein